MIAANAGGAWTPIGDVTTTTMLWIGGQITALEIMKGVFIPSALNLLVPLTITARVLGHRPVVAPERKPEEDSFETSAFERNLMFYLGLSTLVLVPVFQAVKHLLPFLARALTRIDMGSIVFFVGILLSVAVLEHTHIFEAVAQWWTTCR